MFRLNDSQLMAMQVVRAGLQSRNASVRYKRRGLQLLTVALSEGLL